MLSHGDTAAGKPPWLILFAVFYKIAFPAGKDEFPVNFSLSSGLQEMHPYNDLSDFELVALIKRDDHDAYREIYYRYTSILFTHAYSKLQDRDEAKDLVQDVLSNLWLKRNTVQIQTNISGYLYISLRNRIINSIAHKKIQTEYLDSLQEYLNKTNADTDFLTRTNQLTAIVEAEVLKMPVRMREIFELSRKDHLTHRQIAEKLGISEKTVKDHINNALKILRIKLGSYNYLLFLFF